MKIYTNTFPVRIPLGTTGLALTGFTGSFAHNFEPILKVDDDDPKNPTAVDYINWAKRAGDSEQELDIWRPATRNGPYRGGLGLTCDIVTLDGYLLRFQKVGFGFLSFGPVIVFGGRGRFLDSAITTVNAMACIDFGSGSLALSAGAQVRIPPEKSFVIIDATGGMDAFISTRDPQSSYFNLGTDVGPIRGIFLTEGLRANVFFMLNLQRIKTGGGLRFAEDLTVGPFALKVSFSVDGYALLGWNPVQIGAGYGVSGSIRACVWKICLGLELGGMIEVAIPRPFLFALTVRIKVELPWPLPDISWEGKIIDFSRPNPPDIASPLLLGADPAASATKFGALHARSGRQWQLDDTTSVAQVWPDVDLVLPFNRRAADATGIVAGPTVGPHYEGGFSVIHRLLKLKIVRRVNVGSVTHEEPVNGLRAVWVVGPGGDLPALHVPCENPLEWLLPYRIAREAAHETPAMLIEQDFGGGKPEFGIAAARQFGSVEVQPYTGASPVDLLYLAGLSLDTRFLRATNIEIAFRTGPRTAGGSSFTVSMAQFIIASSDSLLPQLVVELGFSITQPVLLQDLDHGMALYLVEVRSTDGRPFDSIRLSARFTYDCGSGLLRDSEHACDPGLLIHRVRWMRAAHTVTDWKERFIFPRGKYRVYVEGDSSAVGFGQSISKNWPPYQKDFEVRFPEQLRPYVHFATIGDSRIFGQIPSKWNPTPFGRGFPAHYADRAVVRFNAPYMSSIFPKLTASWDDAATYSEVSPEKNKVDESYLPESVLKWRVNHGLPPTLDEEIVLAMPRGQGLSHVRLGFNDPEKSPPWTLLDEWTFEKSRYADAKEHLTPRQAEVTGGYNAAGPVHLPPIRWPSAPTPSTPALIPGLVLQDWELPAAVQAIVREAAQNAGLQFIQVLERLALRFGYSTENALIGVVEPPSNTTVEMLLDAHYRLYCLLLRTPEPLDWRRVTTEAWTVFPARNNNGTGEFLRDKKPIALAGRIVPNFDGTQALLFAQVGSDTMKLTRVPNGAHSIKLRYARKAAELPTLTDQATGKPDPVDITYRFVYVGGMDWPYVATNRHREEVANVG